MRLRAFLADELSDLEFFEAADQNRSEKDRQHQCCQAGEGRSRGDVLDHAERRKVREQLFVEQPIQHYARYLSSARSTCVPREPLNRMASPGRTNCRSNSPAVSGSSTK